MVIWSDLVRFAYAALKVNVSHFQAFNAYKRAIILLKHWEIDKLTSVYMDAIIAIEDAAE